MNAHARVKGGGEEGEIRSGHRIECPAALVAPLNDAANGSCALSAGRGKGQG